MVQKTLRSDAVAHLLGKRAMSLLLPVMLTLLLVSWSVVSLQSVIGRSTSPLLLVDTDVNNSSSMEKLSFSVLNALAVVGIIVVLTFIMLMLYKCGCEIVLYVWLGVSIAIMLSVTLGLYIALVCARFHIPYDFITMAVVLWNVAVVGLISIFYYSHPMIRQAYLIVISSIVAWSATVLPDWTTWCLLVAVAIYDIIAVLCPYGPLRLFVEEADKRKRPIPALIYDSDTRIDVASSPSGNYAQIVDVAAGDSKREERNATHTRKKQESSVRSDILRLLCSSPFKLGLGDFVFYGLLCGNAIRYHYIPWMMSTIAILIGLVGTLLCLILFRERLVALPALPISIALGVVAYFSSRFLIVPLDWFATLSVLAL
uniref:Presenilin n=1 Tax=Trypanosoma congolense (strain IL3000) TaxID=1068625 RepID=G0UTQ1_TRYCI|nr:putative presenilin-like aspartic peptidase [Trypanosoma congolense IL3000]